MPTLLSIVPEEIFAPDAPRPPRWVLHHNHVNVLFLCIAGLITVLTGAGMAWFYSLRIPDIRSIDDYRPQVATLVLDRNGRPVDAIAKEFRVVIPYENMPALLPRAFVAAEDSRYWEHGGLDSWSILRAAINNLLSGRRSQGGSTISQQVTRALFLSREKSYLRKITEALLSYRLEHTLSKEEILAIYLNEIYLGDGAYGVEAAAITYFGKRAAHLNLAEIALLAGLPQSPSNYSPRKQLSAAKGRQRYVLNRMAEDGMITAEEARQAYEQELALADDWRRSINGYFSQYVGSQLLAHYSSDDLYRQGLTVATTLDLRLQQAATQALSDGIAALAKRHPEGEAPEGALVVLETATGRIRALVGGTDFVHNPFNRATQAIRQPGSAFKPFVYAAALEEGVSPGTLLLDTPVALPSSRGKAWTPKNYNGEYRGQVNLAEALIHSSNVATVRLMQLTGTRRVTSLAEKVGISAPLEADLTLALGTSPVSLLELTGAYTVFANRGLLRPPVGIVRVTSRDGRTFPWPQPERRQVIDEGTAAWISAALGQVIARGTGKSAAGIPGARGKTGTTDDNRDAWFIGFTDDLLAGVWLGHDRNAPLGRGETGGRAAAPVWKQFMQQAHQ